MQNRNKYQNSRNEDSKPSRGLKLLIAIIAIVLIAVFSVPLSNLLGEKEATELLGKLEDYVASQMTQDSQKLPQDVTESSNQVDSGSELTGTLEMYVIDVGQADSILFIQGEKVLLVDAGTRGAGDDVVAFLKEKGITKINVLIGSHTHDDHMGGIQDVIENFEIEKFYFPERTDVTTKWYLNLLECIVERKTPCGKADAGDVIPLGDASIQFITSTDPKEDKDLNNSSIAIRVTFGEIDFLLCGDLEKEVEEEILESGIKIQSEVFKASHHGSDTSNTREFIEEVDPDYIYISCGLGNKYEHPNKTVIELFEELKIPVYRTDESGTIGVTTDGETVTTDKEPGTYLSGEEKK